MLKNDFIVKILGDRTRSASGAQMQQTVGREETPTRELPFAVQNLWQNFHGRARITSTLPKPCGHQEIRVFRTFNLLFKQSMF